MPKRRTDSFLWPLRSHQLLTCLCHLSVLPNVYQHSPQHPSRRHSQAENGGVFFSLTSIFHCSFTELMTQNVLMLTLKTHYIYQWVQENSLQSFLLYPPRGAKEGRKNDVSRMRKKGLKKETFLFLAVQ